TCCRIELEKLFVSGGAVRNEWMRAALLIVLVIAIGSTAFGASQSSKANRAPATHAPARVTPEQLTAAKSLGSKNAPIVIEDFSDFQCPVCKVLYEATMEQVIKNYVDTGKVFLVHHDFPLNIHAHSREAARWANAAAAIGKFAPVEQ